MGSALKSRTTQTGPVASTPELAAPQSGAVPQSNAAAQSAIGPAQDADPLQSGTLAKVAGASQGKKTGGPRTSQQVLASGGLRVTKTPVPGTEPQEYDLTTRLELGVGLSVGASRTRSRPSDPAAPPPPPGGKAPKTTTSMAASADVQASGVYTRTRRVDETMLERMVDDIEAALDGSGGLSDEAKMIASQVGAGTEALDAAASALDDLAGDPESARALGEGDSFSSVLTVSAGASLSASRKNAKTKGAVTATVEAGQEWKRLLDVRRPGAGQVEVRVGFLDASLLAGSAGVSNKFVGLSVNGMMSQSETQSFHFVLDADHSDFDEEYETIVSADQPGTVRAVIAEGLDSGSLAEGVFAKNNEKGHGVDADYGLATLSYGQQSGGSETTRVTDGELSFQNEGHFSDHATLDAGIAKWSASEASRVEGELDEGQATIDLEHEKGALTNRLQLSAGEFDTLVGRADDEAKWKGHAVNAPDVMSQWKRLRRGLVAPKPDPMEAAIDAEAAKEIAQLRATSTFIQTAGNRGMTVLRRCLDWGGRALGYEIRGFDVDEDTRERVEAHESGHGGGLSVLNQVEPWQIEDVNRADDWKAVSEGGPAFAEELEGIASDLDRRDAPSEEWSAQVARLQPRLFEILGASDRILDAIRTRHSGREQVDTTSRVNAIRAKVRGGFIALQVGGAPEETEGLEPTQSELQAQITHQRMADLETAMTDYRKEERRILQDAYSHYQEHHDTYEAKERISRVRQMSFHWQDDFEDYLQCKKAIQPNMDWDKTYDRALDKYGPDIDYYNATVKWTMPSRVRGFQKKRTEPFG